MTDTEALRRFGKGSTHKTVYFPEWLSMHIALPPVAEQHRIVAEVERRLSLIDELDAAASANLKRAGRLRQSILKRAFEGKLVPQDPGDEPAAAMPGRIGSARSSPVPLGGSGSPTKREPQGPQMGARRQATLFPDADPPGPSGRRRKG